MAGRADLHVHTTASDGTSTPAEVVALARSRGLQAIAVTDHDTVAGLAPARAAARRSGLEVVAGVELSVDAPRGELHLLGYFVDAADPQFLQVIDRARLLRGPRNAAIVRRLQNLGLAITTEEVEAEAAHDAPERKSVGRPHIAAVLHRKGLVASVKEAFDLYLAEGRPAHVPKVKLDPAMAVRAVREAGGVAVLAHPFSLPEEDRASTIADLARHGLGGVEVIYPRHDAPLRAALAEIARAHDLVATGGSDYHGANKPGTELGTGIDGNVAVAASVVEALRARRARV